MVFRLFSALLFALQVVNSEGLKQNAGTSKSWAGTSSYFVQGLSDDAQESYISTLAADGAKVMRTWVYNEAGNNQCVKGSPSFYAIPDFETTIGVYNYATLDALDKVLVKLGKHNMKAIVSIHDANQFAYPAGQHANASDTGPNGNGNAYGGDQHSSDNFYLSSKAQKQFDNRVNAIFNYKGRYSGRTWKNYSSVIMAFDIQNEPQILSQNLCRSGTNTWMCDRATYMRGLLGSQNPIRIATGGLGGDYSNNCTFAPSALKCAAIDILSVHRYAGDSSTWTSAALSFLSTAKSAGKLLQIEEFGVYPSYTNGFDVQTGDINKAGVPWTYWEVVPGRNGGCPVDGDMFTFYIGQSNGNPKKAFMDARNEQCAQDWTGFVW